MTCHDTYEKIKSGYSMSQIHCLDRTNRLDNLNCEEIESLSILYDYVDPFPDLSLFPKLRDFRSAKTTTMEYWEQQDLSQIEKLSLSFDAVPNVIRFFAPALRELQIYIHNNDSDQLSLFNIGQHIIDLRGLNQLRSLTLKHCTGYQLILDEQMAFMDRLVVMSTRYNSFGFTETFPNLKHMIMPGCNLSNISFVEKCKKLTNLDFSYNSISDINPILSLKSLEYLDLYRNPLDNRKKLEMLKIPKKIITEEDKEKQRFLYALSTDANLAYWTVNHARNPEKSSKYMKQVIDRSTDEELFLRYFVRNVIYSIERYSSQSPARQTVVSVELLKNYAIEAYPFLKEHLTKIDTSDVPMRSC